jgi:long-subunit acyl-CoA synthetase (AMP-forming)
MGIKLFVIPAEIEVDTIAAARYVEHYKLAALVTDKAIESPYVLPVKLNEFSRERGLGHPQNPKAKVVQDDSELTYVFSSGTSGQLKGLVIGLEGTEISISRFIEDFNISPLDSHVMYLPFSHLQQRMTIYACLHQGVSLTFTSYTNVLQTIESVKPSFIISPPALYENIANLCRIAAEIYLPKLQQFGTFIRFAITGMAPIGPEIIELFHEHDVPLFEAYGVTEAGFISWNKPGSVRVGSVGRPISKIVLTEEGEIVVVEKNNSTKRYFTPDAECDRKVFLDDGSIATGDIGELDEQGFLYLRGRIKDIIVTAGGKKFNPQEIEKILIKIPDISEVVIIGVGGDVCCFIYSQAAVDDTGKNRIRQQIKDSMNTLESYKNINKVLFVSAGFTTENGYRTRTLKLNRKAIENDFVSGKLRLC